MLQHREKLITLNSNTAKKIIFEQAKVYKKIKWNQRSSILFKKLLICCYLLHARIGFEYRAFVA